MTNSATHPVPLPLVDAHGGAGADGPFLPSELAAMLDNAQRMVPMGSWAYHRGSGRLRWSEATCALFGVAPSAFGGTLRHFHEFVLPEDLPGLLAAHAALGPAAPRMQAHYRIRRPDGAIRWLEERGSLGQEAGGGALTCAGMVMDVTEHKLAHERLTDSLALTRIATRLARLGAWTIDLPERKMTWSEENRAIHEVPPGHQPTLDEGLALFAPEHREQVVRLVTACASEGTPYEFEVPKLTARGRRIWVHSIGEAVRDAGGKIVRLQGAFQDITERKAAEDALRRKDALLHIAGRIARIGGWILEVPQRQIDWSDEVFEILDFDRAVLPRLRDVLRLAAPPGRRRLAAVIMQCAQSGAPFDLEQEITTTRGRRIWLRVSGEAELDAAGAVRRVQGAVQDISERLALEEQLRQAQRLDSLGRLTGGVAHDFNNLLTVILGYAEMLFEGLAADEALQPLAEVVAEAAQRGAGLTQRLLAFARRQALEPRAVDVNALVADTDAMLRRTLGHHIVITLRPGEGLWPALADPMQLDNALLNLCLNARDAMPAGGQLTVATANVQLAAQPGPLAEVRPGPYVMLAVTDTGTGIAPEHMGRIFEPFFTTKEKGQGTGLGLAMTYGFVKQSGGHIDVASQPGRGTTVRLYLPRAEQAGVAVAVPRIVTRPPVPAGGAQTILLVEDDERVRRQARDQLLALGYRVREARDGAHALALLGESPAVDLLFTDVAMPGMSGPQLAALARQRRPDLRVLYTSGYAEDAFAAGSRPPGEVRLLSKPYRREELARQVHAALADQAHGTAGAAAAAGDLPG